MKENLAAYAYFAGWRIVRWLPEKVAYQFAYAVADFLTKRNGKNVSRLRSNLLRTQPGISEGELEVLVKKGMRSYMRYWCDTFRFPDWSAERIRETVSVTNEHLLLNAIAA